MAGHVQLKFVMTECSKTQIRLTRNDLMFVIMGGAIKQIVEERSGNIANNLILW